MVDGKSYKLSVTVYDPQLTAPDVVYIGKKAVSLKMKNGVKATEWSVNNKAILLQKKIVNFQKIEYSHLLCTTGKAPTPEKTANYDCGAEKYTKHKKQNI